MLLDYSYGKAFERLQVWLQEIVLCATRKSALNFLVTNGSPGKIPLRLSRKEWGEVLHWFFRGLPVVAIVQEGFWGYLKRRLAAKGGTR